MKISLIVGIIAVLVLIGIGGFFLINKTSYDNNANNAGVNVPSSTENNVPASEENKIIEIKDFAYSPEEITVSIGDTIVWVNKDSAKHTVTSDAGSELDSELLDKNSEYSHTFDKAGTFAYHCTLHPYMKAKIIVE